jgi:galactokinase
MENSNQNYALRFKNMEAELKFLWQEAQTEQVEDIKNRKLKQYWDMYALYKKHKDFISVAFPLEQQ